MSGATIAARRDGLGYSRKDACDLSGVSEGSIWSVENDKVPRGDAKDRYLTWLGLAEEKHASGASDALSFLRYKPELMGAEPLMGDDDKPVPHVWSVKDRGFGERMIFAHPPDDGSVCAIVAGWKPGHKFRVDGEAGSFLFQLLEVNLKSGAISVNCHGGTGKHSSFRSFRPERIKG